MRSESHLEFLIRIDKKRRSIPCTCRNCGAKFTYMQGFGMRECSAECYAASHPDCTYDPQTRAISGIKPTHEELQDTVIYSWSMHYAYKMLEEGLITLEEYYDISFLLAEKHAPFHGTLFTDVQGDEWDRKHRQDQD